MPRCMHGNRSKSRARQLGLAEASNRKTPPWPMLPEECRREVVELLARLVRSEGVAEKEVTDE